MKVSGLTITSASRQSKEPSKGDHRQPGQTGGMAWLNLPFLEQGELLSQEQIFGKECCTGEDEQPKEGQQS
jgi:hypothetical protein